MLEFRAEVVVCLDADQVKASAGDYAKKHE